MIISNAIADLILDSEDVYTTLCSFINNQLERTTVSGSIQNCGDGSAAITWFLTQEEAEFDQRYQYEGWAEECYETVETFIGSNIHREAVRNSEQLLIDQPDWKDDIFNDEE